MRSSHDDHSGTGVADLGQMKPQHIDPRSGVAILGDPLSYADGAEDELNSILAEATDRSSSSDELAARIHDWPTRYHLSRLRSNLVRPLSIKPGTRVLDVGAGTGAISRRLGENGAEVVALEGSLPRARAAALRCDDLPNVRVVCGSLQQLEPDEPFDLVIAVGVLEYASHLYGGAIGADGFLTSLRQHAGDEGAVVVAIENQLGLKYLLGYAEDHLGEPWVGIEDYRSPPGIRTYARRALERRLADAALPVRQWLYPYPDYKLPTVVLSQACFDAADAPSIVDQLVRTPVVDYAHPRRRFCDDREAHRVLVDAGVGPEVANSFLVVAGGETADSLVERDVLAWHFGGERLAGWLRVKRVVENDGIRVVETTPTLDVVRQRGWLRQEIDSTEPFVTGPTAERLLLDALANHDVTSASKVLMDWKARVESVASDVGATETLHPFLPARSTRRLPQDHLDIDLANFVQDADGLLHYVDREWTAQGGVDLDLAVLRALWYFAHRLIVSGAAMPFMSTITVDELAVTLGTMCSVDITAPLLDEWRAAEDDLQARVLGVPPGAPDQRRRDGQLSRSAFPASNGLPFTALRRELAGLGRDATTLRHELDATQQALRDADQSADRVGAELATARGELAEMSGRYAELETEAGALHSQLSALEAEVALHRLRAQQFEQRRIVRLYRLLRGRRAPV